MCLGCSNPLLPGPMHVAQYVTSSLRDSYCQKSNLQITLISQTKVYFILLLLHSETPNLLKDAKGGPRPLPCTSHPRRLQVLVSLKSQTVPTCAAHVDTVICRPTRHGISFILPDRGAGHSGGDVVGSRRQIYEGGQTQVPINDLNVWERESWRGIFPPDPMWPGGNCLHFDVCLGDLM